MAEFGELGRPRLPVPDRGSRQDHARDAKVIGATPDEIADVNNGGKKYKWLRRVTESPVAKAVLGVAALGGGAAALEVGHAINQDVPDVAGVVETVKGVFPSSGVEVVNPNIINSNAKEGKLTVSNTLPLTADIAVAEAQKRTLEDGKIYFIPPEGENITFKEKQWSSDLRTIGFEGIPEGAIFASPYGGEVRISEYKNAEFPYKDIFIYLDEGYGAKKNNGSEASAVMRVPYDTEILVDPEKLQTVIINEDTLDRFLPHLDAGSPFLKFGTGRIERGQLEISNAYLLTDNNKAVLQSPLQ